LSGRKELTILFNAFSAAELKKGIRALEMEDCRGAQGVDGDA
jgi:hypothetical protein